MSDSMFIRDISVRRCWDMVNRALNVIFIFCKHIMCVNCLIYTFIDIINAIVFHIIFHTIDQLLHILVQCTI